MAGDAVTRETRTLGTVRAGLLALVVLGTLGLAVELSFIGHYEDVDQQIPLAVAAAGVFACAAVAVRPRVGTIRLLQFVMLSYIGAGLIGITLHFKANAEFQRELDPSLAGLALVRKVVEATAPPALAPGVMVQFGLLGLVYTYKHPAVRELEFDAPRKDIQG